MNLYCIIVFNILVIVCHGKDQNKLDKIDPLITQQGGVNSTYLEKINKLIEIDALEINNSYIFMSENGWSVYVIKIVTYKNKEGHIDNKCYVLQKNNQGEKFLIFRLKDVDDFLAKYDFIYKRLESYSKKKLPKSLNYIIGRYNLVCQRRLEKGDTEHVVFAFKPVAPTDPSLEEFIGIVDCYQMISKLKAQVSSSDGTNYKYFKMYANK